MKKSNVIELRGPESARDALTELVRDGARKLIKEALESELEELLARFAEERLEDGRQRVVRNGYHEERSIQTGVGPISAEVPRVRDRLHGKGGVQFSSMLVPRYLRKTATIDELVPWLYLKGISAGQMQEALKGLLGEGASGFSATTVGRLKACWEKQLEEWKKRSLVGKRYVYFWADGIHMTIRAEDDRLCLLVILGVSESGEKELVAMEDGYRESEESWKSILRSLQERGLEHGPTLSIGDGALGFWKAIREVYPSSKAQRCWQHKTINVLDKLPKSMKNQALSALHEIWQAPTKAKALVAWNKFRAAFKDKYPKAVETLEKDKDTLLTFFSFPAAHWRSIRTTNPIESMFASIRHRSYKAKGSVSRDSMHAFAFKLALDAQKRFNRLAGFTRLAQVIEEVVFNDGLNDDDIKMLEEQQRLEGETQAA
jgi:putative transposase